MSRHFGDPSNDSLTGFDDNASFVDKEYARQDIALAVVKLDSPTATPLTAVKRDNGSLGIHCSKGNFQNGSSNLRNIPSQPVCLSVRRYVPLENET